jgi:hypothetical protein
MLCLSYYCLFLLFNRTGKKCRKDSVWKGGGMEERVGERQEGEMTQTTYAHVNK